MSPKVPKMPDVPDPKLPQQPLQQNQVARLNVGRKEENQDNRRLHRNRSRRKLRIAKDRSGVQAAPTGGSGVANKST